MKVSEFLKAAKELIASDDTWCKGTFEHVPTIFNGIRWVTGPTQYCSIGALEHVRNEVNPEPFRSAMGYLTLATELVTSGLTHQVSAFNDASSHAEVMAMWDKAIELAETDEMWLELKSSLLDSRTDSAFEYEICSQS
jgi:hypothetical protein